MRTDLIYGPLIGAILLVLSGAMLYYVHRYGGLSEKSILNKYKPSKNNFLIKLKLFKYDNNFNYFLLVPYLMAWIILFLVFVLYILYWCGIVNLYYFFINKWVNWSLIGLSFLYIVYGTFIDLTK